MILEPDPLGPGDLYRLMTSIIVPRPIAWVTTLSSRGIPNLAPFSYFQGVASKPPLISISIGRGRRGLKDTLVNIRDLGEFVVHLVEEDFAEAMVQTSAEYAPDVSEIEAIGWETVPSCTVQPPRLARARVAMECELERDLDLADDSVTLVIGQVRLFHLEDSVAEGTVMSHQATKPIGRLGGQSYCRVRDVFDIPRPRLRPEDRTS